MVDRTIVSLQDCTLAAHGWFVSSIFGVVSNFFGVLFARCSKGTRCLCLSRMCGHDFGDYSCLWRLRRGHGGSTTAQQCREREKKRRVWTDGQTGQKSNTNLNLNLLSAHSHNHTRSRSLHLLCAALLITQNKVKEIHFWLFQSID